MALRPPVRCALKTGLWRLPLPSSLLWLKHVAKYIQLAESLDSVKEMRKRVQH